MCQEPCRRAQRRAEEKNVLVCSAHQEASSPSLPLPSDSSSASLWLAFEDDMRC